MPGGVPVLFGRMEEGLRRLGGFRVERREQIDEPDAELRFTRSHTSVSLASRFARKRRRAAG